MKFLVIPIIANFFGPIINFFVGWVAGWLIQIIMGTWITDLLMYFGVNLPVTQLPFLFGFIAAIATFFVNSVKFERKDM